MSVTKAVVFQKGEKVRPHFKNLRALGFGLALVFGTVGECGSATLSRGEMVEFRGVRGVLSLYLPPKSPHCGSLRSRCYSWGLCILAWYWTLETDRQTDSNVSAGMQQRIFMFDPTDKPERRVERTEWAFIHSPAYFLFDVSFTIF